jgi:uncharacterized protein YjiS (DUF1127 family)
MAHIISFPASAPSRSLGLFDRVKKAFADLRLYQATVRELDDLSDRELSDLGISRSSIRDIARQSVYAA